LLRRHPLARPGNFDPLHTADLDLAAPDRLPKRGGQLADAIKKQGFAPKYRSHDDKPPVTSYLLEFTSGFELEFIAPLRGGGVRRDGTPDSTVDLLGVSAQKLRHVELLLIEPYFISMPELGTDVSFAVANPASFVLQHLLILPSRPTLGKKGKDALYVHDVLQLFTHSGRIRPEVVAQAKRLWSTLSKKQQSQSLATAGLLGDANSNIVKEASRIVADSLRPDPPSAQAIALSCRLGLAEVLQ
jgi:hypothetical protein